MRLTGLIVAIVLAVTGCSGREDSAGEIRLLLDWKAQMEHVGFFVALERGYYRDAGLSVEILDGSGAPSAAQLVGNGTYPIGVSSGSATVMARAKGIPVVSVAMINQHSPVVVYSLSESGIEGPHDLIGKRIGVNIGGTKHREFQALLKHLGIPESDLQLMGMTESSPAPLLTGQVDAMLGYTEDQPVTVELRDRKVNRIHLADHGIDLYSTNIIVNEPFMKTHPDVVEAFVRASLKGWSHAIGNPRESVQAYMAHRPESDADFNRANFTQLIPILKSEDTERSGLGAQTEARWSHTIQILFDLGMIDRRIDLGKLYTNRFLPASGS